jgi:parallel beta-helix repeat protein
VLVAPGIYRESLKLSGKSVTLASHFLTTNDPKHIAETVIDAMGPDNKRGPSALVMDNTIGRETKIIGFTFQNASHAVTTRGHVEVSHNRFTANGDALSFESGTGVVRSNVFEGNTDDGIDMDGASAAVIEDNIIRNNRDDGIEVRLHKYNGAPLEIVIRRNLFVGNGEDGLQLIDYPGKSDRTFRVERNVFAQNAMAAIGSMKDGNTKENYAGTDMPERVYIINNTIIGGQYGITGGDNMVLLNNVITGVAKTALKRIHGDSAASKNLLWKNGTDVDECDIKQDAFLRVDPLLDAQFQPTATSPCVDAGNRAFEFNGESLTLAPDTFKGTAPDLGAKEAGAAQP